MIFHFLDRWIKETSFGKTAFLAETSETNPARKEETGVWLPRVRCHTKTCHLVTGKLDLKALLHNICTQKEKKNTPYVAVFFWLEGKKNTSFQSPVNGTVCWPQNNLSSNNNYSLRAAGRSSSHVSTTGQCLVSIEMVYSLCVIF